MSAPLPHKIKRDNYKKRFAASELTNFTNTEILEFFLSYAMPSRDNGELAQKLLNSCGSVSAVFDAPDGLLTDNDISENAFILLKCVPQLSRFYLSNKFTGASRQTMLQKKIISAFIGAENENVLLVLLDKKGSELYFGFINSGTFNASELSIRKIIDLCLKYRCDYAMIAHNHPSSFAYPSKKDVETTIKLNKALSALNVDLTNHFIVSGSSCFSMANNEEFYDIFI